METKVNCTLRKAHLTDLKSIRNINVASLPENYPDSLWKVLLTPKVQWVSIIDQLITPLEQWVAVINSGTRDEKIVGYVISVIKTDNIYVRETYIWSFAVLKEYRRMGIGKSLLQQLQRETIFPITLNVRKSNLEAFKFYCKMGFKYKKLLDPYYENPDEPGLIMAWDLQKPLSTTTKV